MTEPTSAASSPPRPLLVRFGAMGDLVLVQPMIRLLSERFGAPVLDDEAVAVMKEGVRRFYE